MKGRFRNLIVVVAAVALVAAACGDDEPAPTSPPQTVIVTETSIVEVPGETVTVTSIVTETSIVQVEVEVPAPTPAPPPQRTNLTVTTLHLCSETHVGWAVAKGLFAEQGIEVLLIETEGAVTGLAAILSGAADISTTNAAASVQAVNEGFPVKLVAGSFSTNPEKEGFAEGIVVAADSDIESPADFAGRSIAVNELGSLNHIATAAWVRAAGVDPATVEFVGLPFPFLTSAVTDGRVDAALMVDSQVAALVGGGAGRYIGNPLSDVAGPVPIAAYFASDAFIEGEPELLASFIAAMEASVAAVNNPANRDEVLTVMSEWCGRPMEGLTGLRFKAWEATIDGNALTAVIGMMMDEGFLDAPIELSRVATPGAIR